MKKIAQSDFQKEVIESEQIVIVDVYAEWCQPCRMLAPIMEKVAKEYEGSVTVVKIDIEESAGIVEDYKVSSLPTILFFKGGAVVKKLTGLQSEKSLKEALDMLM